MFFKLFTGITCCLSLSTLSLFSTGIFPHSVAPGVHAIHRGLWAVFDNPAGMAEQSAFSFGFSYHSGFLMEQVSSKSLALGFPLKKAGVIGFGYRQFGYSLYKDQHACLAFARSFGTAVTAGLRFDYLATRFGGEYGGTSAFTGSAGLIARITNSIRVGASIFNPQRVNFSSDGTYKYPAFMLAGASWNFGGETELALGIAKSSDSKEIWKCAIRYEVSKRFFIHAAIANGAEPFSFGYNFRFSKFDIGMTSGYHQLLGFSPAFSLIFKK